VVAEPAHQSLGCIVLPRHDRFIDHVLEMPLRELDVAAARKLVVPVVARGGPRCADAVRNVTAAAPTPFPSR
jgi:hypothetical protein